MEEAQGKSSSGKKKKQSEQMEDINKSFEEEETKSATSQEKTLGTEFIFIQLPKMKYFSNILSLIPMQILVEKICLLKKINPDMPRNLAKTVTV